MSCLAINNSWFKNTHGTRDVIGGTHKAFTETESSYQVNIRSFPSGQYKLFNSSCHMNFDTSMLHVKFKKNQLNEAVVKQKYHKVSGQKVDT